MILSVNVKKYILKDRLEKIGLMNEDIRVVLPDSQIELGDFVNTFSKAYFLPEKENENTKISGITYKQNSKMAESLILAGNIEKYDDFARFMAWKIGRIKHHIYSGNIPRPTFHFPKMIF